MYGGSRQRSTSTTVNGQRVEIVGTRARLANPPYWELGDVRRDQAKPPTWTATTDDEHVHTAHSRRLALAWLLEATADERAVKDAARTEQIERSEAEAQKRAAEDARAADLAAAVIRSVWPEHAGPSSVWGFAFSPNEMLDLLCSLLEPGAHTLPIELAVTRLVGRFVALCSRGPDPYDVLDEPFVWGYLVDVAAERYGDGEYEVEFVFEGRDRADEFESLAEPCIGPTAVATSDAVTMTAEGGYLVAVIAEDDDTFDIGGPTNIEHYERAPMVDLVNRTQPTFWDELDDVGDEDDEGVTSDGAGDAEHDRDADGDQ